MFETNIVFSIFISCFWIFFIFSRIIRLVPKRLTKWQTIIDANIDEIKSEYIFVSKKSVVDFVLGKSLDESCNHGVNLSRERHEIREIGKLHAHS